MNINEISKNREYLKRSQERQRKKYFSQENIEKRKEKAIQYRKNIIEKQKQQGGGLKKFSEKILKIHEKDLVFYEEIWNKRKHYCENCGKFLGNNFYDLKGNLITYRYAHIIPKSTYPYLRHCDKNILLLCLDCHTKLDNSPKEILQTMKCYDSKLIEELKQLHKELEQQNNEIYK